MSSLHWAATVFLNRLGIWEDFLYQHSVGYQFLQNWLSCSPLWEGEDFPYWHWVDYQFRQNWQSSSPLRESLLLVVHCWWERWDLHQVWKGVKPYRLHLDCQNPSQANVWILQTCVCMEDGCIATLYMYMMVLHHAFQRKLCTTHLA